MSGTQYTSVETDTMDWSSVRRSVRLSANRALKSELISKDTHKYLIQHCTGPVRESNGNLLSKIHRPLQPKTAVPVKTRPYIDTVNCATTPLARYISVMLIRARKSIPYRLKDKRHLMTE